MLEDLDKLYPMMSYPIRCENGCGVVIEIMEAFSGYERDSYGGRKLICQCCAAEIGHVDEAEETPEQSPVCKRKPKIYGN